jgi:hypothetical protein
MKKIELAYQRLPKLLNKFGFSKAYVRNENEDLAIILCDQKKPLSLREWLDLETFIKLDISRNIIILGQEQIDNLDGYLLIKGSE